MILLQNSTTVECPFWDSKVSLPFRAGLLIYSTYIYIYDKERTARTGSQDRIGRTGQAELYMQNREDRTEQEEQDRQKRTGRTGQTEDRQNRKGRMGQAAGQAEMNL
jgi:hypothetical protein